MLDCAVLSDLVGRGYSQHQIAAKLGCSQSKVRRHLIKLELKTKFTGRTSIRDCPACHQQFSAHGRKTRCCSSQCHSNLVYCMTIARWQQEPTSLDRHTGQTSGYIKRWLVEQRGENCWQCGWNQKHEKTGRCPIEVDHIDGNHMNNQPSNLRLLCPNCHALTSTYKNRNKGNGRHARRVRYAAGQSY